MQGTGTGPKIPPPLVALEARFVAIQVRRKAERIHPSRHPLPSSWQKPCVQNYLVVPPGWRANHLALSDNQPVSTHQRSNPDSDVPHQCVSRCNFILEFCPDRTFGALVASAVVVAGEQRAVTLDSHWTLNCAISRYQHIRRRVHHSCAVRCSEHLQRVHRGSSLTT